MKPIFEQIENHHSSGTVPFHVPGHKRSSAFSVAGLPYFADITEIEGFDNLLCPSGILKDLSERTAALFGARSCFPLTGGSTTGILAAVRAMCPHGGHALIARNCHKSVYHALELCSADISYILPETGESGMLCSITPESVADALEKQNDISLVVVTSPTYDGVVSDTKGIAAVCRAHGALLLCDAAHGAHFGLSGSETPERAIWHGADAEVISLHKSLPALTGSAALLTSRGCPVSDKNFAAQIGVFHTSSPPYPIIASFDQCVRLLENGSEAMFGRHKILLNTFLESMKKLKHLKMLCKENNPSAADGRIFDFDNSKLIISTKNSGFSGPLLMKALRSHFGIEAEMAAPEYVLCVSTVADSDENFNVLANALLTLDGESRSFEKNRQKPKQAKTCAGFVFGEKILSASEAKTLKGSFLPLDEASGFVCLDYLYAYPPGIPLLVPGEMITPEAVSGIKLLADEGISLQTDSFVFNRKLTAIDYSKQKSF